MLQGLDAMLKVAAILPICLLSIITVRTSSYYSEGYNIYCYSNSTQNSVGYVKLPSGYILIITTFQECRFLAFVYTTLRDHITHHGKLSHVNYLIQKEIRWKLVLEFTLQCQVSNYVTGSLFCAYKHYAVYENYSEC